MNTGRVRFCQIALFLFLLSVISCNGSRLKIPTIQFQQFDQPRIETRWSGFNVQSMELSMGLVFRFDNPTSVPLPFLGHEFKFVFDGNPSLTVGGTQNGDVVPPNAHKLFTYPIKLNLVRNGQFESVLGRDVPYRFEAGIKISGETEPFVLAYENSVRLPLLPIIQVDTRRTPAILLQGSIKEIDLSAQVNAMKGFVNLLIGIGDPLIAFLGGFNRNAETMWSNFKDGWRQIGSQPAKLADPLNSTITGLRFKIPLIVRNPNRFPIQTPAIRFETGLAGQSPASSFHTVYQNNDPVIPAKVGPRDGTRELSLEGQINWSSLGRGLQPLIDTTNLTVLIKSEMKVDFGYGPADLKFEIRQSPFVFGQ